MELNHLKYFYFVAREGGFSKASRALRIAQPAITRTVKNLENDLGFLLFDRIGKTIRLTKMGNDVYRKCELIFKHVEEIRSFNTKPTEVKGPLNIGAAEPISHYLVPSALKMLLRKHPGVYPQVSTATGTELLRLLLRKQIECALMLHAPEMPSGLEVCSQFPLKHALVVAAKHAHSAATCESFIGSREVDDVSNKNYPTLNKLRAQFPRAEIRISTNSLSSHRQMVLDGMGVSVLPDFIVGEDLRAGRMVSLLGDLIFNLKVVRRKGHDMSPAAKVFLAVLRKNLE